jgi:Tol biopolymer transport system component
MCRHNGKRSDTRNAAVLLGPRGVRSGLRRLGVWLLAVCTTSLVLPGRPASAIDLVSVGIHGTSANAASSGVAANADGSIIAFYSDATDLVAGDTNQARDVFIRDRVHATTERVSVSGAAEQANRSSHAAGGAPAISGDGQVVAFYSDATNLIDNDTNGQTDVFVRLRHTGATELVSVSTDGTQGNGPSLYPSISSDGRFVAFESAASNLVPNDTNGVMDIFIRDRIAGTTERVCDGVQGNYASFTPSISADGNFVAFASAATNLVAGDTNGLIDVFVCDRRAGAIERVSLSTAGAQGNGNSLLPAIDGPGCVVAFKSTADNLVPNDRNGVADVFARDLSAGVTERLSVSFRGGDADAGSYPPSISFDGRFVAFGSAASNLVPSDANAAADVFVRDRQTQTTRLVDINDQGEQANDGVPDIAPGISGDGTEVGFVSAAWNLAGSDLNQSTDVFVAANPLSQSPEGIICCQCEEGSVPTCQPPVWGACPPQCTAVCNAVCLETGSCATVTPAVSPTPTGSPGPSTTPTPQATGTSTPTGRTATATVTGSATATPNASTATATSTAPTPSVAPTVTETPSAAPSVTATATQPPATGTATPTPPVGTATATPTPIQQTPGPTAPLVTDCCQCAGPSCQPSSPEGECPADCTFIPGAACEGTTTCVTLTPTARTTATPTPTAVATTASPTGTPTVTAAATATPTSGGVPPTLTPTTRRKLDDDAWHCAISPKLNRRGALLWLAALAGLLLRSRRRP